MGENKKSIPWQALREVTILLAKRSLGMHNLSTSYLSHVPFFTFSPPITVVITMLQIAECPGLR